MTKSFAVLCTMGVVLLTLATANAEEFRVTVPFDFVVNGKMLPAATYTVTQSLPNDETALAFLGEGTGALASATEMDTTATGTKLVFHRVGDQYFLSDVVTLGGTLHFTVSKTEAQLARTVNEPPVLSTVGN
jgi:uncharacterized membrane protein YhhN